MKVENLKKNRLDEFINYCMKHRNNIDNSFLYDEDLINFIPNEENPTYIVVDEEHIIAAASLIIDDYNRRGQRARFRIFHSKIREPYIYQLLMDALLKHTQNLKKLILFVPLQNENYKKIIESINFKVERFSFVLIRKTEEVPQINLPKNYKIKSFRPRLDELVWCHIRNKCFAQLKGNQTPIIPTMMSKSIKKTNYIEGGLKILYHLDKPIGIVRGNKDEDEGISVLNIGPLAVLPEYQGKGLGTALLRTIIKFAKDKQFKKVILCVNAENEKAKRLYIQEGFQQIESVACYRYELTQDNDI